MSHTILPSLRDHRRRQGKKIIRPRSGGSLKVLSGYSRLFSHGNSQPIRDSIHKTCASSSQTKSHDGEGGEHEVPLLNEEILMTNSSWETPFSLSIYALVI